MRIAIVSTYTHPSRRPRKEKSVMQSAVPYLLASLCPAGAKIEIYNEKEVDVPLERDFDLVLFSYMHAYYEHTKVLSALFRRRGIITVAGGRHAGHFKEDAQKYFDAVVVGEPEANVPALFRDLAANRLQKVYDLGAVDPADIKPYRWDLMDYKNNKYTLPVIEASRGCPFSCNFCVLTGWEKYRCRPIGQVVAEIESQMKFNKSFFGVYDRTFAFADNNLGGSPDYLRALCEALIPLNVRWGCAVTYNILADRELVKLMGKAGCRYAYTGLESLSPESIKSMRKGQNNLKDTANVLRHSFEQGILASFGLLVGSDGDTEDYLSRVPDYLDDLGTSAVTFLGIVCPYPETPFFKTVIEEDRLLPGVISRDLDGYTLCHRPKNIEPEAAAYHFQRLAKVVGGGMRAVKNAWHQLFLSRMPGYKAIVLAGAMESASIKAPLDHDGRTYIAGRDPIEAWDAKMMAELGLEPQRIEARSTQHLVGLPRRKLARAA